MVPTTACVTNAGGARLTAAATVSTGILSSRPRMVELRTARPASTVKMTIISTAISFWRAKSRRGTWKMTANACSIVPNRLEPLQRKPTRARIANRPVCVLTFSSASSTCCC